MATDDALWAQLTQLEQEHKAQGQTGAAQPLSAFDGLFTEDVIWALAGGVEPDFHPTAAALPGHAKISASCAFDSAALALPHVEYTDGAGRDDASVFPRFDKLLEAPAYRDDFAPLHQLLRTVDDDTALTRLPPRDVPLASLYSVDWHVGLDSSDFRAALPDEEWAAPVQLAFEEVTGGDDDDVVDGKTRGDGDVESAMSLNRKPGAMSDFVRGNSQNVPFAPGGIDVQQASSQRREAGAQRRSAAAGRALAALQSNADNAWLHSVPELHVDVQFTADGGVLVAPSNEPSDTPANANDTDAQPVVDVPSTTSSDAFVERQERFALNATAKFASSSPAASSTSTPTSLLDQHGTRSELAELLGGSSADFWSLVTSRSGDSKNDSGEPVWARTDRVDVSNWAQKVPSPALEFPFDLDRFQKEAIYHLEQGENVFIAAHTSAGKTVVAEYAIALAAKHLTRAIYTSPIKALSNQKYRDFKDTFGDVGLITGDVQVSPESSCLVVTTEILRSMLYKGADLIRDVEWVIFDEVHYVNDLERGVVWEEVIIMLPKHVNMIFLSATVPNTFEFADWVGRTKRKQIWVISTDQRPTPLEHYLAVDDQLFKILDSKKNFLTVGHKNAAALFEERNGSSSSSSSSSSRSGSSAGGRGGGKKKLSKGQQQMQQAVRAASSYTSTAGPNQNKLSSDRSRWVKMLALLRKNDLLPAVVFAFSKKKCQNIADSLTNLDLTSPGQSTTIHFFIESSLARLSAADRKVPQVVRMRDLLRRGIGVHHGGLLPIIKEIVEILFSRGLIKVLFATETFAMGVNMPARTVLFDRIRKHDGQSFRTLLAGEYIQMSGRAGRRGLDTVGTVIVLCWSDMPDVATLSTMMVGAPTKLSSQFRLTYNMLLNLLRVQDFRVEDMMKRSFSEVHRQKHLPDMQRRLAAARQRLAQLDDGPVACIYGEPDIEDYYDSHASAQRERDDMSRYIIDSGRAMPHLTPGRVVALLPPSDAAAPPDQRQRLPFDAAAVDYALVLQAPPPHSGERLFFALLALAPAPFARLTDVPLARVAAVCRLRLPVNADAKSHYPSDSTLSGLAASLRRAVAEALPERLPTVDPVADFKINDLDFHDQAERYRHAAARAAASKCHTCSLRGEHLRVVAERAQLRAAVDELGMALSDSNLALMPEFQKRLQLLQQLDYVDAGKAILVKGRVAREFNTAACELLATELVFDNSFAALEPAEMIAVLSVLVFQQKSETAPVLPEQLAAAREHLQQHAERIAALQRDVGMQIAPEDYLKETLHFGLMEIAYEWARGMPFADICALSDDIQEGSIVRCITRLDETCKELRNVARIIGDSALFAKAEQASVLIKRDIVFASSLYIQ